RLWRFLTKLPHFLNLVELFNCRYRRARLRYVGVVLGVVENLAAEPHFAVLRLFAPH
ncbi:MAG: hypothetical protein ACI9US_004212, partial [Gammaproteobacteria bacterium]